MRGPSSGKGDVFFVLENQRDCAVWAEIIICPFMGWVSSTKFPIWLHCGKALLGLESRKEEPLMIIWLSGVAFALTAVVMHFVFVKVTPLQKRRWLQIDYATNAVAAFAVLVAAGDFQYYQKYRQASEDKEAYSKGLIAVREAIDSSIQYCKDNARIEKIRSSKTCRGVKRFLRT
jgi:hypothetical protein